MRIRLPLLFAGLALAAGPLPTPTPPKSADVKLEVIRYDSLTAAVTKLRGKVVVVDFWADFCLPCKREFPHLVALHRKHRAVGLATLSVALDANTPAHREAVTAFLRRNEASFANYLLDEPPSAWQAKLKVDGPPLVFVFNRKGELARKFVDEAVNYAEIDKLVTELLRE